MNDNPDRAYFEWLVHRVHADEYGAAKYYLYGESIQNEFNATLTSYWYLCDILYDIPFTWTVPMDENRAMEGRSIRYTYAAEMNISDEEIACLHQTISVLEVLIGLAIRWENAISYDPILGDQVPSHFFEMLENLDLLKVDDNTFTLTLDAREYVEMVIRDFMNRHYNFDGTGGGLFPIKELPENSPVRDQRTLELWLQLNDYVAHKYL